ncbi:CBS domain-containing protein [Rhizobium lusitanum]|jgi:CBS domain-containing protein|uniref:BON domain-containing protein n=1 Tax=Rhizobium lusitanum TaxID=293958 RepID=A0A1C3XGB9_9HYPH|nr:CBS domain-containing protein [Rhizobium lusitanum]SCB51322.1 BON domain-containing protein [Rhizobium lusitanum]
MQAKDIMTRNVITATPRMNVRNAALLMRANDISGLPIIDDDGKVCGMLTEGDLMRRFGNNCASAVNGTLKHEDQHGLNAYIQMYGWSVGEAMSHDVISVTPDTDVGRIGGLMLSHKIKRVPVINDHRLVGIVSRSDLLNLIIDAPVQNVAIGDDALRLAIRTRLVTDLGIGSDRVDVTVKDGQVEVRGNLDSDIQRQAIRILVENIRGVGGYVDRTIVSPSNVVSFSATPDDGR